MAELDDVGTGLTGVDPATAGEAWDGWMERPGNRQALLQMGLQLMQPVAIGQTPFGHIGQAIGAGGEAATRVEDADTKQRVADAKLAQADEKLRLMQQNADSTAIRANAAASRANSKGLGGLSAAFQARAAREDARRAETDLDRDAASLVKQVQDAEKDILNPKRKEAPNIAPYVGKTKIEIRDMLRTQRAVGGATASNSMASGDDTEEDAPATDPAMAPADPIISQYPTAKKYADGNYYMPDPKNPGKYLQIGKKK